MSTVIKLAIDHGYFKEVGTLSAIAHVSLSPR
jgi:hypothetical protein